ncbi:MAG: RNA polymerase sigma factor [Phycisphaerales bacterium]
MDYRDSSDESLMETTRGGSRAAFEVLIRRFSTRLLTFLVRLTGRLHSAEDLFQETFAAVWTRRETYKVGRAFKPWLYAIAVNKFREGVRRAPELTVDVDPDHASWARGEEAGGGRELAAATTAALARLSDRQREVLVLHLYGGLSYAQVGECLDCGEATARGHMFQALAVLRREMRVAESKEAAR